MATIQFRARIDRDLKKKSDAVLKRLGLDATSFVSMALTQLVNRRGIPFAVTEPDAGYFGSEYGLTPRPSSQGGRCHEQGNGPRSSHGQVARDY